MKRKRTLEDWVLDSIIYTVMILVLILTVYPFYYVVVLSFNDGVDAYKGGIFLWPRAFTWANYKELLSDDSWLTAIFISVSRTVAGTFLGVLMFKIINNTLVAAKVPTFLTGAISGAIIIIAVLLQNVRSTQK